MVTFAGSWEMQAVNKHKTSQKYHSSASIKGRTLLLKKLRETERTNSCNDENEDSMHNELRCAPNL